MLNLRLPLLILAIFGLIGLAGCGDDDSTTTTAAETTEATSTTEDVTTTEETVEDSGGDAEAYGTELTSILADFSQTFQEEGASLAGASDPQTLADGIGTLESTLQKTIDDLSALEPPEEAQSGHDKIIASFEDLSSKLADVGDAVDSGDAAASTEAATDLQASLGDFTTQFTEGLTEVAAAGVPIDPSDVGP